MPSSGERTVAVAHHPTEIQPWLQMPYPGGTTSLSRDHRHRLEAKEARARSSVIDEADIMAALVRGELAQHGARSVAFAEGRITTRQSVRRLLRCKQEEAPSPSSRSKEKANLLAKMERQKAKHAHSIVFKTVPSAKGIVFRLEEGASASNSVTSEPSVPLSLGVQRVNSVLSGGNRQSKASLHTRNVFSCDSIHNTGDGTLDQCQTDTDPSGRLCILADIHVRARTTSRTHYIRVKVDPGADANLLLLHHFREIFPYLCDKNGKPKEGVLKKAESSFESYSGDNVSVIGQTKIYAKNKQTQQFMITRIFVIARERGPILLCNAACQWLGLIAMLIENKAPVVERFVASVTREETECGEVEAYPLPKTGDGAEMTKPTSKPLIVITAPKKKRIWTKKAKPVANASEPLDVTLESTPSKSQPSAPERTEPDSSQEQNTVLSGNVPQAKLGLKMKGTGKKKVKDGPIRKADSTEIPRRKYYRPAADAKTYRMNGKGQLQCQQDPKDVTRVGSVKELPLCREKPIFHDPVGALIKDKEQLTAMYPNSFDRIGSLKGEYTILIDPSVTPVQQARRKVPIESKEAICMALDSMITGDILEPQIEPTPWVNSATYPVKLTGEVRPCLDCVPLNKAIIRENHTLPMVEEIAHRLAGARYFTKGDAYKAFLHVHLSKKSRELTVFGTNTHGRLRYKRMPFGMKMSQDMFQIQMDRILEQCPGVIGIHDDVIIYGYTWEDHDTNLINFLNVC